MGCCGVIELYIPLRPNLAEGPIKGRKMQNRVYMNRRGEAFVTQSLGSAFRVRVSECVTFFIAG